MNSHTDLPEACGEKWSETAMRSIRTARRGTHHGSGDVFSNRKPNTLAQTFLFVPLFLPCIPAADHTFAPTECTTISRLESSSLTRLGRSFNGIK